jgi:hypothetical protein
MANMEATIRSRHEEWINAIMGASRESTEAHEEKMKALPGMTEACPVKMEAKKEPAPEETEAMAETSQEVPEGTTGEEMIGATKDRSRDLHLDIGCRGHFKMWTRCDGRVRQEYAVTVGWPTYRTVTAMRKGELCKGPGKKCRRGIGGQSKASCSGKSGRIVKWDRNLEGKGRTARPSRRA